VNLRHLTDLVLHKLGNWRLYTDRLRAKLSLLAWASKSQMTYCAPDADRSQLQGIQYLEDRDLQLIQAQGLVVVGKIEVPVQELHFQYRSEFEMDSLLVDLDGRPDRSIVHSPFCKLLETYEDRGLFFIEKNFRKTDHYRMLRHRSQLGYYFDWVTGERRKFHLSDAQILNRIRKLIRTYESIKQRGYLGPGFRKRYIIVLEIPFEVQRFGKTIDWDWHPYEIWSGHHRAAALVVLGYEKASVILLKSNDVATCLVPSETTRPDVGLVSVTVEG
jgi:hypothetical protein